jgi:hypothetical protein
MLKRMWVIDDGECRKRYVASCHTRPCSMTACGTSPNVPMITAGERKVRRKAATFAMMMPRTAGVIGPGPND